MLSSVLVIEDDEMLNELLSNHITALGYKVHSAYNWQSANHWLDAHEPDLILLDGRLPDASGLTLIEEVSQICPVIIVTAYGNVRDAVDAINKGASDYLTKPVDVDELELVILRALAHASLKQDYQFYKHQATKQLKPNKMIGDSPQLCEIKSLIEAVAPSEMTVLIHGESGVGKELISKEIHNKSLRCEEKFLTVDCCTIQENLFESELFGHEKGAFTGADQKKIGLLESAKGGTVFLDEIGEIPPAIQAKLLRVLETNVIRRVGGTKDIRIDVRIITATNKNLQQMVEQGNFRRDLFFRLNAFTLTMPSLQERRSDIPHLVEYFVTNNSIKPQTKKTVTQQAMKHLVNYDWPGNIREMKNLIERAIIISRNDKKIRLEHLNFLVPVANKTKTTTLQIKNEPTLDAIEKQYLEILLKKYPANRIRISKTMGVSERSLYRMMDRHQLKFKD